VGIALDGDADRLQIVNAQGRLFNGDELLYIVAAHRLDSGDDVPGVVGTLMTNMAVELALRQRKQECRAQLDKLQEFVFYQLNQSVPEKLKSTEHDLSNKIDKTIEETHFQIGRQIQHIEDVKLPEHRVHI
jgi:phosphomannomutase